MSSLENGSEHPWREYDSLRKRAQLSLLAAPLVLGLVLGPLVIWLIDRFDNAALKVAILLGVTGIAIVAFAVPVVKWAQWRCPRCGKRFAQPEGYPGSPFSVIRRLLFRSPCANCALGYDADPHQPVANDR